MGFIILFAGSFWVLFLGLLGISDSTKDRLSYLIAALAFLVVMTVTIPVSVAFYAKSRIKCCKTQPDSVTSYDSHPGEKQSSRPSKSRRSEMTPPDLETSYLDEERPWSRPSKSRRSRPRDAAKVRRGRRPQVP